jgi:L-threonylcarbamoyladenylate synthase
MIKEAVKVLDANRVVMYPTESSYALGVNALEETAVRRVLRAKERPSNKPIPVIVSGLGMWKKYSYFNKSAETLVRKFMPGPLTIALRKKPSVPDMLNLSAIAARIPSHPVALALVNEANYPITSTSANVSGKTPVYDVEQIPSHLESTVDLVLDAGVLKKKRPSTIVDFTVGPEPVVTREGSVPTSAVLGALKKVRKRS